MTQICVPIIYTPPRATLLPDPEGFLSIEPPGPVVFLPIQDPGKRIVIDQGTKKVGACWKADVSMSGMRCDNQYFGTFEDR